MSEMRIKTGLAIGPYGTAGPTSSQSIFTPGDTTPDVSNGNFFLTANTSATTISYFDVLGPGGVPSTAANGKLVTILFQDALTTIQNGGNMYLSTVQGAVPANTMLDFVYFNSSWFERSRASATQQASNLVVPQRRINLSAAGSSTINVTSANDVVITSTGASLGVLGFAGGVSGQAIRVFFVITGGQVLSFAQSAGNLALAGTNAFAASGSAFYNFFTADGIIWNGQAGLLSP